MRAHFDYSHPLDVWCACAFQCKLSVVSSVIWCASMVLANPFFEITWMSVRLVVHIHQCCFSPVHSFLVIWVHTISTHAIVFSLAGSVGQQLGLVICLFSWIKWQQLRSSYCICFFVWICVQRVLYAKSLAIWPEGMRPDR